MYIGLYLRNLRRGGYVEGLIFLVIFKKVEAELATFWWPLAHYNKIFYQDD
jgi:hypothetical protein